MQGAWLRSKGIQFASAGDLEHSLIALDSEFPNFEAQLRKAGWDLGGTIIRSGPFRLLDN